MNKPGPTTFGTLVAALLAVLGVQLWLVLGRGNYGRNGPLVALGGALLLCCVPALARRASALLNRLRTPSLSMQRAMAASLAIASSVFLVLEASSQLRTFTLKYHDEYSYQAQAFMIAHGRLWMPPHPLADFFESFQFIAEPVYGSIYFPGAAMLYAPGIWLSLPHWAIPVALAGLVVALIYRVFTELLDGVAGLLAAACLLGMPIFRLQSIMVMSPIPSLLLAMGMVWAWLRLVDRHSTGWAVVLGVLSGWAAITRPVDTLCVAIPLGLALMIKLRAQPFRRTVRTLALILACALPFLGIQAAFNLKVTGDAFLTPFDHAIEQTQPQTRYGFHGFDPSIRPQTHLLQKQESYDRHVVPFLEHHTPSRRLIKWRDEYLPTTILNALPHSLLLVFLPAGFMLMNRPERWVIVCILPLFVLLYFPYAFFMTHYTLIAAPSVLFLLLAGAQALGRATAYPGVGVFTTLAVLALAGSSSSFLNRTAMDEWVQTPDLIEIDRSLASIPEPRAIVLFRFVSDLPTHEPVYNVGVLWPDNAPLIRAHDLGERNIELYRYYAARHPDRVVYLYDRGQRTMTRLGPVAGLLPVHPG